MVPAVLWDVVWTLQFSFLLFIPHIKPPCLQSCRSPALKPMYIIHNLDSLDDLPSSAFRTSSKSGISPAKEGIWPQTTFPTLTPNVAGLTHRFPLVTRFLIPY